MRWCRLYVETPSDPKLRRIAHVAGTTVSHCLAVWTSMLCHAAGRQGDEWGTLAEWDDTDCAINLGIDPAIVFALRREMEGRLLDGKGILNWNKRQYDSDSAAERTRRWREKKTQQNQAPRDAVTASDVAVTAKKRREENKEQTASQSVLAPRQAHGMRLPDGWVPSPSDEAFADGLGIDLRATTERFRDYWTAQPGAKGRKSDWPATWRNWCRREAESRGRPATRPTEPQSKTAWMFSPDKQDMFR